MLEKVAFRNCLPFSRKWQWPHYSSRPNVVEATIFFSTFESAIHSNWRETRRAYAGRSPFIFTYEGIILILRPRITARKCTHTSTGGYLHEREDSNPCPHESDHGFGYEWSSRWFQPSLFHKVPVYVISLLSLSCLHKMLRYRFKASPCEHQTSASWIFFLFRKRRQRWEVPVTVGRGTYRWIVESQQGGSEGLGRTGILALSRLWRQRWQVTSE